VGVNCPVYLGRYRIGLESALQNKERNYKACYKSIIKFIGIVLLNKNAIATRTQIPIYLLSFVNSKRLTKM
jgi:hypothetical protein